MPPRAEPLRPRVADSAQAAALVAALGATMTGLEALLEEESALLGAGKVRAALALESRKSALAADYLRGLEAVKANTVALARLAPAPVARLKAAHAGFQQVVERNQAMLATARAVSEGLVRGVAEEAARQSRPAGYGAAAAAAARRPHAGPLVVSARL